MRISKTELNHKDLNIAISTSPSKETIDYLWQGIRDYNRPYLGVYALKPFTICLKNSEDKIIARVVVRLEK